MFVFLRYLYVVMQAINAMMMLIVKRLTSLGYWVPVRINFPILCKIEGHENILGVLFYSLCDVWLMYRHIMVVESNRFSGETNI